MVVKEIADQKEWDEVMAGDKPVVVDFHAVWCGPCKVISPVLDKLSEKEGIKDKVTFIKVDVDNHERIAQENGIRAMPTFMLFKNGEKIDSILGANPPKLTQLVENAAANAGGSAEGSSS